jgi:GT2 family glycosyltransferase
MKLSILIAALKSRAELLQKLATRIDRQIDRAKATEEVEYIMYVDEGEAAVGYKRNALLAQANGEYVVFVDDDDDIADDYVEQILLALRKDPEADCVGFRGLMSVAGRAGARQVIYSLQNDQNVESGGTYYRLPGHLTPLRKAKLQGISFPEKNLGEDADFSGALYRERRLRKEVFVDKVLYHYRFDPNTSKTQPGRIPPAPTGIDQTRFDIVILSNQPDNLRGCLDSILLHEPCLDRSRIVVVDDGSKEYCEKEYPGITWVEGKKPFIFARNANLGIARCPGGVILLNDDARLTTRFGFHSLAFASNDQAVINGLGLTSAAIDGFVGNENQKPWSPAPRFRADGRTLAFIAVFIPAHVLRQVGTLDERFVGYGYEDNDFCLRVRQSGRLLSIYDGCVVEHNSKENKSTFRVKPEISMLLAQNRKLFEEKWKKENGG